MLRPELVNIVMLIHFVVWDAKNSLVFTSLTGLCRFLEVLWVAQTSEGSKGPRFEVDPSSKWVRARQGGPRSGLVKHKLCKLPPFGSILQKNCCVQVFKVDPAVRVGPSGPWATGTSMMGARKVRKGESKVAKVAKAKEDPTAKVTMEATDTMKAAVAWL